MRMRKTVLEHQASNEWQAIDRVSYDRTLIRRDKEEPVTQPFSRHLFFPAIRFYASNSNYSNRNKLN